MIRRTTELFLISILILFWVSISACSRPESFPEEDNKGRLSRMTPEEKEALAPNELFIAVINGDTNLVQELINSQPELLLSQNSQDGNTPLGVAIQFKELAIAKKVMEQMTLRDLFHQNFWGESYVFLAAREGYGELIESMSSRYYLSLGGLEDYEFSDLDQQNKKGQTALHVAKDRKIVEIVEIEYYRGLFEYPVFKFTLQADDEGKNFLHHAANSSRTDILRWSNDRHCKSNSWEEDEGWIWKNLGFLFSRGQRGFQTYIGGLGLGLDSLVNWQDLLGKTPIHYAAERKDLESVQVLSSCQWTSFDRTDIQGDIPLQTFLLNLDPSVQTISENDRRIFDLLVNQKTKMKSWLKSQTDYLNHQNNMGKSSLHIAAALADPYFYQILSVSGDIELKDNEGLRPIDIFQSRRARLK